MRLYLVTLFFLFLSACGQPNTKPKQAQGPVKGELAFLLQYNGQMPSDVGFLTNHVVERRLANIMKDSFQVFMSNTRYDRPIMVLDSQMVAASFFSDSDRTNQSAWIIIDVPQDAVWAGYSIGDSSIDFSDHPSLPVPGISGD
jgi:hypothetical protein